MVPRVTRQGGTDMVPRVVQLWCPGWQCDTDILRVHDMSVADGIMVYATQDWHR